MTKTFTKKYINSWLIVIVCAVFYCYQFLIRVSPNTLNQEFMLSFGVDALGFGIIVAFYNWAYSGLQIPLGITLDRINIKFLLPLSPILCGSSCLIIANVHDPIYASIARFMAGMGSACGFIGTVKVASLVLPTRKIGIAIGITILFGTFGAGLGGQPLEYISTKYGWRNIMTILSVVGLGLSVLIYFALSSVLVDMKQKSIKSDSERPITDIKNIIFTPQILLLALYGMLMYTPISLLGEVWGSKFVENSYGLSHHTALISITVMFLGAGIGGPVIATIAELVGSRKKVMIVASFLAFILYCVLLYTDVLDSKTKIYVAMFFAGVLYAAKALTFALACEIMPRRISGLATAYLNMAVMGAGVIFNPIVGYLLDKFYTGPIDVEYINYSKHEYSIALSILPIAALLSFVVSIFLKDSMEKEKFKSESEFVSYSD